MFEYTAFNFDTFNRKSFSDMYELCFGQKVNEDYFKWKYEQNPAGKVIAYSASENGITVSFYGIIPEKYLINGKPHTVYQSMDTMTHPAFQKKGLFKTLAEKTYSDLLQKDPKSIIIGIPGSNSYHSFVHKLNWKSIHHFSFTFIHKYLFKSFNGLIPPQVYKHAEIKNFFDPTIEDFLEKIINPDVKIQTLVDSSFLDWRIKRHPFINYKSLGFYNNSDLTGIIVYHITEKNTCFIDWIGSADKDKKQIIRTFCRHIFGTCSSNFIYTWKPVHEKQFANFKSLGFISNPLNKGPFSYKVPFIVYAKTNEINGVNLYDINNYYLDPIIQD